MTKPAIQGLYTALITPFRNGKVDEKAFQEFVSWQIAEGVHGLVPCGTTGESPTLSHEEHKRIVERCVAGVKKRVPVIAGTGSNSTRECIDFTAHAKQAGADAALIVTPYYNKPTQDGLYAHYKTVAKAVNIPIIIYNIPGRCVIDMKNETMLRHVCQRKCLNDMVNPKMRTYPNAPHAPQPSQGAAPATIAPLNDKRGTGGRKAAIRCARPATRRRR